MVGCDGVIAMAACDDWLRQGFEGGEEQVAREMSQVMAGMASKGWTK